MVLAQRGVRVYSGVVDWGLNFLSVIFLMLDPGWPFSQQALAMLRKRVHVFATTDAMADAIASYDPGSAVSLRDDLFYSMYVNRGSPQHGLDAALLRSDVRRPFLQQQPQE